MKKMKKIAALTLSLLTAVSLLAGCGQKSPADQRKAKNEIAVGIAQDLGSSLDPRSLASAGAREVLFNVFEGLYKPTSSGDFVPALATDCQVTDEGKTYTFTLREGVKFHNGKTMTADDVVYTFKSYAESSTDSNLKAGLAAVADVKADGNKVIISEAHTGKITVVNFADKTNPVVEFRLDTPYITDIPCVMDGEIYVPLRHDRQ